MHVFRRGRPPVLTGRIVRPGTPEYPAARQEFNLLFNKFPRVIVFAQETKDVINAIRWARFFNVPIRMRSGRHSFEGLSVVTGGIVIDVSDMHQVDVNRRSGIATVQTGTRSGPLDQALWDHRLAIPIGGCPTTGIAGVTLGGGHSLLSRTFGLTQDHLLDAEIVTADGRVLHANANQHADLFWALRGGAGGNFGICTTFRFSTHPINTVGFAEIGWDLRDLEPVLRIWQNFSAPGATERFDSKLGVGVRVPSLPPILMQGIFLGSAKELHRLLEPLLRAGSPRMVVIKELPWIEAIRLVQRLNPITATSFKSVGPYVHHRLPEAATATVRRFVESQPSAATGVIVFESLGGAIAKVPNRATAYFYRKALFKVIPYASWHTQGGSKSGIQWVENFRRAMLPFTRGAYVNYPDLHIQNWPQAYYGDNFARLTKVKRKYDPKNIFHFPQSIPPAR